MFDYLKFEELVNDKRFQDELKDLKTVQEIQAAFSRHDVELSEQEVEDLCVQVALNANEASEEELDESALENVSGGFVISFTAGCIYAVGCACVGAAEIGWAVYRARKARRR